MAQVVENLIFKLLLLHKSISTSWTLSSTFGPAERPTAFGLTVIISIPDNYMTSEKKEFDASRRRRTAFRSIISKKVKTLQDETNNGTMEEENMKQMLQSIYNTKEDLNKEDNV